MIVLGSLALPGAASARSCSLFGVVLGTCEPGPASALAVAFGFSVPDPGFGTDSTRRTVRALVASGATHVRTQVSWDGSGSTPEQVVPSYYDLPVGRLPAGLGLRKTDDLYRRARRNGITPIIIVFSAPAWATRFRDCAIGVNELDERQCPGEAAQRLQTVNFPDPAYDAAYGEFTAAVARRYPKAIIEGWNEPDGAFYRNYLDRVWGDRVAQIQCAAYDAVKAMRKGQQVLSPSIGVIADNDDARTDFITAYYDEARRLTGSTTGCHDGQSVHIYPGVEAYGAGSRLARWFGIVRLLRRLQDDRTPLWITETGWSTTIGPPAAVATQLPKLYARLIRTGDVAGFLMHTLRDAPLPVYMNPSSTEYGFGWLRADWSPKPHFCRLVRSAGGRYRDC